MRFDRGLVLLVALSITACGKQEVAQPPPAVQQLEVQPPVAQQADPNDPRQILAFLVNGLKRKGDNCALIGSNIETHVQATGIYDDQQITTMLVTAKRIGCF